MATAQFPLPTGKLTLTWHAAGQNPAEFFTVVARDNPKRAFLFLSHCLGKHLPTAPARLLATWQALAAQLADLPLNRPVLFIGMAETATALARGVYDTWLAKPVHAAAESLYLATTRYQVADAERLFFCEAHSHAPNVGLHLPVNARWRARFFAAETLVLIDDEMTTGRTFVALVNALRARGVPLKRVYFVTLTDFSADFRAEMRAALAPLALTWINLFAATWQFHATDAPPTSENARAQSEQWVTLAAGSDLAARLGADSPLTLAPALVAEMAQRFAGQRLLLLGCGEFMAAPARLALALTAHGLTVDFCAPTRSPIRLWGAVQSRLAWPDPYGEGVQNFLYNFQRDDYDAVALLSEIAPNAALRAMARALRAELFFFRDAATLTPEEDK